MLFFNKENLKKRKSNQNMKALQFSVLAEIFVCHVSTLNKKLLGAFIV